MKSGSSVRSRNTLVVSEEPMLSAKLDEVNRSLALEGQESRQLGNWDKKKRIWIIYVVGFMVFLIVQPQIIVQ